MSFSSHNDYFIIKGTMMVWDRQKKVARPATCADCGMSKAYNVYGEYGLCQHLEHKVRCLIMNCAKDPEDLACVDFVKVC